MFRHAVILPPFLSFQGIARERLCSFPIAPQQFLDDVVVLVMRGDYILFLATVLIGEVIAAWSRGYIGLID